MSQIDSNLVNAGIDNIVQFPIRSDFNFQIKNETFKEEIPTPIYDAILLEAKKLDALSKFPSNFDYGVYKSIELRYKDNPIRGGITMKTAFRLVNSHSTCQQCLYAFEIDTYGRGCIHNCLYCYAKAELTVHGYWNNPIPAPIDINEIRKIFYTVFETDKKSRWREILEQRIPLRIGSMSDSFMWTDKKMGITKELLRILKFYNYPYVVFTRSDLIAEDEYIDLLDTKLAAIQFSMSSTNEALTRVIEPGAPSPKRRLKALKKLGESGFWTTVRLNPFFPTHPDGYYSDPNFKWNGPVPHFNYSSFDMIDEIAESKVPAILGGFARFSSYSLNQLELNTKFDLRQFFKRDVILKSARDWHYSDAEIRTYYKMMKEKADLNGIEFTTCYIGNGELQFWRDQDIWSNKKDCCNIKGKIASFTKDSREIPFETRLKYTGHKNLIPSSEHLHRSLNGSIPSDTTETGGDTLKL